jgi:hypothetical protein
MAMEFLQRLHHQFIRSMDQILGAIIAAVIMAVIIAVSRQGMVKVTITEPELEPAMIMAMVMAMDGTDVVVIQAMATSTRPLGDKIKALVGMEATEVVEVTKLESLPYQRLSVIPVS